MTTRHDHAGAERVLRTQIDTSLPPEEQVDTPVLIGTPVVVAGCKGILTGACAPHEEGATGLVFVVLEDAPLDENGNPVQHEFVPEAVGLRWS